MTPRGPTTSASTLPDTLLATARTPPVRSSDDDLSLRDPFLYFLTRRLGIVSCLNDSDALATGSWIHLALELDDFSGPTIPVEARSAYLSVLSDRQTEIETNAYTVMGLSYTTVEGLKVRENQRALKALAIWETARSLPLGPKYGTLQRWLSQPHIQVIAREHVSRAVLFGQECVGVLDLVIYNTRTNTVWVIDLKSTSNKAQTRCASFLLEMQTLLYPVLAREDLASGRLLATDGSSLSSATVGGMIHIVVEKPAIKFCSKDRSYNETPHVITRGPRKGHFAVDREYFGEPKYENFLLRVSSWMTGTGDYEASRSLVESSPRVEVSTVPIADILGNTARLREKVERIGRLANLPLDPLLFPYNARSIFTTGGELSPYADFYLNPPTAWPTLMGSHGFIVRHREGVHDGEGIQEDSSEEG